VDVPLDLNLAYLRNAMSSASSRPEYAAPNTPVPPPAYIHDVDAFADAEDDDSAPAAPPLLGAGAPEPDAQLVDAEEEEEDEDEDDDWNQDEEDEEWAQLGAVEDEDWGGHEKGACGSWIELAPPPYPNDWR
jgi:hypothetical protein